MEWKDQYYMFAYIKPSRKRRGILINRYRGGSNQCSSFFKFLIRTFIAYTSRSLFLFSIPLILRVKQGEWISQQEDWSAPAAFTPFRSVAGASPLAQSSTQEEQKAHVSPQISHIKRQRQRLWDFFSHIHLLNSPNEMDG